MSETQIGVIGGSGFRSAMDVVESVEMDTPWGPPSGPISIGFQGDVPVAFLPRHGAAHEFPPHRVPYRANVWAMKQLGVERLIGPCAAGSLQRNVAPGSFVVCDQLVDRTKNRGDTFFEQAPTTHISFADPYCPSMRPLAAKAIRDCGVEAHDSGTVVVIEGPRFSSRAESHDYAGRGWQVINMTQHPEAPLAREAEICYVNISLITDYDAGFTADSGIAPVSVADVVETFDVNNQRLGDVLKRLIDAIADLGVGGPCPCRSALDGAQL